MTFRKLCVTGLAGLTAALMMTAANASQGDQVGETQMCIDSQQISDTPVIDHRTILVKMDGRGGYKRIDLANNCTALDNSTGFAWSTSLNKLCVQDTLKVIGGLQTCIIDQIVTIDKAEADALLKR